MPNATCKRIMTKDMKEISRMNLSELGIHIHFDESNIQSAKAMIIGPKDTPYENGVLFFKITFPHNYPYSPPKVEYVSPSTIRIHPNLYVGNLGNNYLGKVCLSILNTWSGPKWTSIMHIGSVLITIQSLLDNSPIHHEPGFEKEMKTSQRFINYNEIIKYDTFKTLIIKNCYMENEYLTVFKEEITEHISKNSESIINTLQVLSKQQTKIYISNLYRLNVTVNYKDLLVKYKNLINI
jgi:ubiquitin-protein ligase